MQSLSIKLPDEQIDLLKKRKEDTGIPISFQIRTAIDLYFKNQKGS